MDQNNASSEIVAAVILIAVFAVAVGIVGVFLLSNPPGDEAPAMLASVAYDNSTPDDHLLVILHEGGDSLRKGEFQIFVNGVDQTDNFIGDDGTTDWTIWETGQPLTLDMGNAPEPDNVLITGEGIGGSGTNWVLHLVGEGSIVTVVPTTEPPGVLTASFTASPTNGSVPLTVDFTDTSTGGPTAWSWDFGDGTTSTEQNPTHIYAVAGTYTVTLTASNAANSDTATATITVSPCIGEGLLGIYYPEEDFTGTPVQRIDQRIWFADATGNSTYHYASDRPNWPIGTLGQTDTFSVIEEGYLIVPDDDTYTFYLTSDDGSRFWIDAIDDGDTPFIDNWGLHAPTEKSGSIALTAGAHPVRLKMYEHTGAAVFHLEWSSSTFERTPVDAFCRGAMPVSASFTATPRIGTAPLEVNFTDTSTNEPTAWSWDFGDGATSTEQNPTHIYTVAGTYTVTLTVSNAAGYSTATATVRVLSCSGGLLGTYYPTTDFTDTPVLRIDRRIWFADASGAAAGYASDEVNWPIGTLGKTDTFSVIEEGSLLVPDDDTYTFYLTSDDGSRLWIDDTGDTDTPFIDNWGDHSPRERSGSITLSAGAHPIRLKMYEKYGQAVFHLEWSSSTFERTPVDSFCHEALPVSANFTATPLSGTAPLQVNFTDTSTNEPTAWSWDFGDGATSVEQNPTHTYTDAGTYTVSLTASNAHNSDTETKTDYITANDSFVNFLSENNVFVYGSTLSFGGDMVSGPGATVIVKGGLDTSDLNGGASVSVSNIYIDGGVNLNGGGAGLGSKTDPGNISVNGDLKLWQGGRDIYGDVYVNGSFDLKDARIHGNVYVNGDLTLGGKPPIDKDARIYYTGTFTYPAGMSKNILKKCIYQATVPGVDMPDEEIAPTKSASWYTDHGYVSGGALADGIKIYADSYDAPGYSPPTWSSTANNVVIIASSGDITLKNMDDRHVTGVFYAPNGKVIFKGASLEGVVVARDGFFVTSGGTTITFKNIENYISDPDDYPF